MYIYILATHAFGHMMYNSYSYNLKLQSPSAMNI